MTDRVTVAVIDIDGVTLGTGETTAGHVQTMLLAIARGGVVTLSRDVFDFGSGWETVAHRHIPAARIGEVRELES